MKYMLLIYQDAAFEQEWATATDAQKQEVYDQHVAFGRMLEERGALAGGAELGLSHTATTVRRNGDGHVVTDGPYAELAEQLGGYYLVEARDLDEALELARALPSDVVEVRPLAEAGAS
jgi:hypothetical protein